MRWKLGLSQQKMGRSLDRLLRIAAILSALWAVGAGYGLYHAQTALRETRKMVKVQQQQAIEMTRSLRQKQATAAQSAILHLAPPDSAGAAEWANQVSDLMMQSQTKLVKMRITSDAAPGGTVAPPPGNTPQANVTVNPTNGTANVTAPLPNGVAPAPPGGAGANAAKDPDDGWKKVKLECRITGTFRALASLLNTLAETPFVVEINQQEMGRENFDPHTGEMLLYLKLNLTLYGLPKKP